jgi:hypothetical protein
LSAKTTENSMELWRLIEIVNGYAVYSESVHHTA